MRIRWGNIFAFLLLLTGALIALSTWRSIGAALRTLWAIGASHHPDEQVRGIIVLGLLGAVLVGIVRITVSSNGGEQR